MKRSVYVLMSIFVTFAATSPAAHAQDEGKSLAATLGIYAFPKDGQALSQQSKDEASCYDWSVSNTGSDPFDLQKKGEQQQQQTEQQIQQAQAASAGAGAAGAVKGAAAGALIGEIAGNDVGNSAAWGAAVVGVASRRRAHRASEHAQEQAAEQGAEQQQATEEQIAGFKKAFSACMEAKDYIVK
ncbi:MAG TPA: glycine zipper family protein [Woeseiaceae bacterium]|nr:glycine zipper family protein [Woeseiaceae bacterium]